jgi:PAS domain S-box-containing protein
MNLHIFKPVSIKAKVTIFTLTIFVIGIWSLTFYASRMLRADMEKLLGEQQLSTVSMVAQEIGVCVSDRLLALETVAREISPAILDNASSVQALLEQRPLLQFMFNSGVFVTRMDGTSIADVPFTEQRIGMNYLDRDYMIAALKDGTSSISRPVIGRRTKSPGFAMAVPIRDTQGKIIGALTGATDLGRPNFLDNLTRSSYGPTGGYLLITPKHRQIITATDKKRIMEVLPAAGVNRYVDRNIAGYEGYSVLVNPLGEEQLASVKQIPAAGWYMLLGTPTAEAFEPIRTLQRRVLLAAIVLTLLAGGLIWWITSRMLRSQLLPMITAAEMVDSLAAGNRTPQPLPVIRQDEIGQLVGGFNRLLLSLGQRENALKEQEEHYRLLVKNLSSGVVVHAPDTAVLFSNPMASTLLGLSKDQMRGKEVIDPAWCFLCEDGTPLPLEEYPVNRVLTSGAPHANQVLGIRRPDRDGAVWVQCNSYPVTDAEGEILQIVVTFTDISERKRIEDDLRTKTFEIEQFMYTVSHDLRSPLVTVKTFMGYLEKDMAEGDQQQLAQDIQYIHGAADKMKLLLDELLEFSRIGRIETPPVNVSLKELIAEVLDTLAGIISEQKVEIHHPDTDLMLFGDRPRFYQLWQNLIENAIKYSRDDRIPHIELGIRQEHGNTVFFVRDNGIGIAPHYHSKVFGIFEKLDPKSPGAGLGLSMVQRIVEKNGGRVWVESEGVGDGCCFHFTLPGVVLQGKQVFATPD